MTINFSSQTNHELTWIQKIHQGLTWKDAPPLSSL
jgi:hypothetical protein